MTQFSLTENGTPRTVDVIPDTPLLWVLRDTLGLTGTKYGCGIGPQWTPKTGHQWTPENRPPRRVS